MFTTYPENYQSLHNELIYNYQTGDEEDITLFISDSTSDEIIGVKKFYSSTTAEINIAPIVRGYALPDVVVSECGFVESQGAIKVEICDMEENSSDPRIFTISHKDESAVGAVTTLPTTSRVISLAESEILTFRVDPTLPVTITQQQYTPTLSSVVASETYSCEAEASGLVRFCFVATSLSDLYSLSIDRVVITVSQGDATVATVDYAVIDRPIYPTRVAWISSRGSIEHYTFPITTSRSMVGEGRCHLSLTSAYESQHIRSALGQIIESPRLWLFDGTKYLTATISSSNIELSKRSTLATVAIDIEVSR